MIRGLYTSASGMMAEAVRQETITNNITNSETPGFKKDLALQRSLSAKPVVRTGSSELGKGSTIIGQLEWGSLIDQIYTKQEQGLLLDTGRELDLALTGRGFFTVETPAGTRYTRNGAFTLDADRFLVTEQGYRVLGQNGYLQLPQGEVHVDENGNIRVGREFAARLQLTDFPDLQLLQKEEGALFAAADTTPDLEFSGNIRQGCLEGSNVQIVEEMVNMMAALRAYESNQRALMAQDELLGKAVNEVGAIR